MYKMQQFYKCIQDNDVYFCDIFNKLVKRSFDGNAIRQKTDIEPHFGEGDQNIGECYVS